MSRKADILKTSLKIAAKGGMLAVTLSEVARQVKCSHGTVSFHFKSLAGLRKAVRADAIWNKNEKVLVWLRAAGEKV